MITTNERIRKKEACFLLTLYSNVTYCAVYTCCGGSTVIAHTLFICELHFLRCSCFINYLSRLTAMLFSNLDALLIFSALFWLFTFFCVLGPCLRRKYICGGDNTSYNFGSSVAWRDTLRMTTLAEDTEV